MAKNIFRRKKQVRKNKEIKCFFSSFVSFSVRNREVKVKKIMFVILSEAKDNNWSYSNVA